MKKAQARTMKTAQIRNICDLQMILLPSPGNPSLAPLKCLHPPNLEGNHLIPKGRSIAHHNMARKGTVYVFFDIETGGEYCGILQLSAEMVRVELKPVERKKGASATFDYTSLVSREALTFNRFVKSGERAIWNDNVTSIHGLHQNHPSIIGADDMDTVWEQFVHWYEENTMSARILILSQNSCSGGLFLAGS